MPHDLLVNTNSTPIAVRDYSGPGQPLLLLHGAGENLAAMVPLALALSPHYRVVSVDLRGHGLSAEGSWFFDDILDDLAAVVAELRLGNPAVVGHSLGGMLAAAWAQRHPEAPGAVNLDGNPLPSHVDQLPGLPPDQAAAQLTRFQQGLRAIFSELGKPVDQPLVHDLEEAQRAAAAAAGIDETLWARALHRKLAKIDGVHTMRPSPWTLAQLTAGQAAFDPEATYAATISPLLVVSATRGLPMHEHFPEMWEAFRRGTTEKLDEIAARVPSMEHVVLDGSSHSMYYDDIDRVVTLITNFLAR